MKKLLTATLLTALCMMMFVAPAIGEGRLDKILADGKLVVATSPDFAPYEFMDPTKSGQDAIVGHEMTLARYIAEKLGVELVIEAMDFTACQAAVTQGKVDVAISGFARTEERAENMEISDYYNYDTTSKGQGIIILKENADALKTAEDFAGKKIGTQNASLQYNLLTSQLPDAVPEMITSLNDGVMMVITGKIDGMAVAGSNGAAFADNYDTLTMSEYYFDYTSEGNVLLAQKGETELMAKINEIIAEVNEQDLYPQWNDDAAELARSLGIDMD